MTYPSKCVVDTTFLMDVRNGGMVAEVFKFPSLMYVPDVILAQMSDGELFVEHRLTKHQFDGKQVREVSRLRSLQPQVSVNDMFAFVLARDSRATLLTGDRNLCTFSEGEGVEVQGVLWLLDELVQLNIISPVRGAAGLERMIAAGSWLPREECDARLSRWKSRKSYGGGLQARV